MVFGNNTNKVIATRGLSNETLLHSFIDFGHYHLGKQKRQGNNLQQRWQKI